MSFNDNFFNNGSNTKEQDVFDASGNHQKIEARHARGDYSVGRAVEIEDPDMAVKEDGVKQLGTEYSQQFGKEYSLQPGKEYNPQFGNEYGQQGRDENSKQIDQQIEQQFELYTSHRINRQNSFQRQMEEVSREANRNLEKGRSREDMNEKGLERLRNFAKHVPEKGRAEEFAPRLGGNAGYGG